MCDKNDSPKFIYKSSTPPLSNRKIRNPFDKVLIDKLHQPICSPVMCKVYKKKNTGTFRWEIDQHCKLVPADIVACNSQFEPSPDPVLEKIAEEATEKFFSQEMVMPSPSEWSKKVKPLLHTSCDASIQLDCIKETIVTRDVSAQTILTLPPELPPEIEKLLLPFCTFTQDQDISGDYEITANGSLRRKLYFDEHSDIEHEHDDSEQTDDEVVERPPSSFETHSPVKFSPDLSLNCASKGMKRTFGTPLKPGPSGGKQYRNKILDVVDFGETNFSPIEFRTPKRNVDSATSSLASASISPVTKAASSDDEATLDEINSAYRRLSRIFHPDKHHSAIPNKKKWAQCMFNKVKEAYEVLSDTHKRAIYDTLGKRGLEVDGWEVIFRTRTPREIREEYERLRRERVERRLQQRANPRGNITLAINATDLFTKYYDEYKLEDSAGIPSIEVSGMSIQQSVDAPVTLRNTITVSRNISTQNGIGNGTVNISNRYLISEKGSIEGECGIGNEPQLGFKLLRTLSRTMFLNCGTMMQFKPQGISPSFYSTLAFQLNSRSVGYLTYRVSLQGSSMSTLYVRDCERFQSNASLQIGKPHSFASFNVMWKLPSYGLKLRLALKGGTFGAIVEYGAEKKISQNNSVSAAVMLGVPSGVTLKLKWTNSSQTIAVPIHLCEEILPSPVFYATVIPVVSWVILKKLVLDPISKERDERRKKRSMEANFERLQEMQRQARATVELMEATHSRIRSDEEKKKGLVILKAVYGKLPHGCSSHPMELSPGDLPPGELPLIGEFIEVTIPLQCLVRESKLELLDATKSELPGFYDPCVGETKHLTVQYMFKGNLHLCTIEENQAVVLPRNNHKVKRS